MKSACAAGDRPVSLSRAAVLSVVLLATLPGTARSAVVKRLEGATYAERAENYVTACSQSEFSGSAAANAKPKYRMAYLTARLLRNVDVPGTLERIGGLMDTGKPADDYPFNLNAAVYGWLIAGNRYPPALVAKTKAYLARWDYVKELTYRAANYELMTFGAGYIAAERWPDFRDSAGHTAPEIKAFCGRKLENWFTTIPVRNVQEHGPIYYGVVLYAVKLVADFAQDPVLRTKARMCLDWLLLSLAMDHNQGYWVGSSDRSKTYGGLRVGPDSPQVTGGAGWLYFGSARPVDADASAYYHTFWLAYQGTYRLPRAIEAMAQDRNAPVEKQESVLFGNNALRRYVYHTPRFGLASQYEEVSNVYDGVFKEMKRTVLRWVSDKPDSFLSPSQENLERPYDKADSSANAFGYGENPFQQVMQHRGTAIGIYSHEDPSYPYRKTFVPFPLAGAIRLRTEADGWVICHGGTMLFAFKCLRPYAWGPVQEGADVLWSDFDRNGWILETADLEPYATGNAAEELEAFRKDLVAKSTLVPRLDSSPPGFAYKSIHGYLMDITYRSFKATYAGQCRVDGKPIDYRGWPLSQSPWHRQESGSNRLSIRYADASYAYDFANFSIDSSSIGIVRFPGDGRRDRTTVRKDLEHGRWLFRPADEPSRAYDFDLAGKRTRSANQEAPWDPSVPFTSGKR